MSMRVPTALSPGSDTASTRWAPWAAPPSSARRWAGAPAPQVRCRSCGARGRVSQGFVW